MTKLHVMPRDFPLLGEFMVGSAALGFGEMSVELQAPVHSGQWRALCLDDDAVDALVAAGRLASDEACIQLLLIHAERDLPDTHDLPSMRELGEVGIDAAILTVADAAYAAHLDTMSPVELIDVHGEIPGGWGVHLQLGGDGSATVWAEDATPASLLLVELY